MMTRVNSGGLPWRDLVGEGVARLRIAYILVWFGSTGIVITEAAVAVVTNIAGAAKAAASRVDLEFIAGTIAMIVALAVVQAVLGRAIRSRLTVRLRIPVGRRFPTRALLSKTDFCRWVESLPATPA